MKSLTVSLCLLVAASGATFAASEKKDDSSNISVFKGRYNGTVTLSQSGTSFLGTTQGNFAASQKKEQGTLGLNSFINAGGTTAVLLESYAIRNRTLTYTLSVSGTGAVGTGTARVSRNGRISYSALVPVGGNTATVTGTMRKTRKRLLISEAIAQNFGTALVSYNLRARGN